MKPADLPSKIAVYLLVLALGASAVRAQAFNLNTTYAGGNGLRGAMFDLAATGGAPLKIQDFDINTASSVAWEVYVVTAQTSFFGLDTTPGAWTLLATTPVIPSAGIGNPTPLNLSLNYSIPAGAQKVGFYINSVTTATLTYTNGTAVNQLYASDANISFYEGMGKGALFTGGATPRVFNGTIYYDYDVNILSLAQSGPGVGDLSLSVTNLSATGGEGYLLISSNLATLPGQGPIIGLTPDAGTFTVFSIPYAPGNPLHFNAQDGGVFPQAPFVVGPGSVNGLAGITLDVSFFLFGLAGGYDSRSNLVRYTFQ